MGPSIHGASIESIRYDRQMVYHNTNGYGNGITFPYLGVPPQGQPQAWNIQSCPDGSLTDENQRQIASLQNSYALVPGPANGSINGQVQAPLGQPTIPAAPFPDPIPPVPTFALPSSTAVSHGQRPRRGRPRKNMEEKPQKKEKSQRQGTNPYPTAKNIPRARRNRRLAEKRELSPGLGEGSSQTSTRGTGQVQTRVPPHLPSPMSVNPLDTLAHPSSNNYHLPSVNSEGFTFPTHQPQNSMSEDLFDLWFSSHLN